MLRRCRSLQIARASTADRAFGYVYRVFNLVNLLKLIACKRPTGRVGSHIDVETCTRMGIAVAEGVGSPIAPAELAWALIMAATRRLPQYIGNLKHGAWQQSGLKAASMPPNFGLGPR